jgi:peptidoglycan/LPS O-acetylase OafA/YrhL
MNNSRDRRLDALRGIAILLVMGVHFGFHAPEHSVLALVETAWRRVGLVAVDLFFVLSGFLIGSLLLTEM